MTFKVSFLDSGREPQCKPDPKFPDGQHADFTTNVLQKRCCYNVPYPAPRCGSYIVECDQCQYRAAISVAGRPDDVRMVTLPCKAGGLNG